MSMTPRSNACYCGCWVEEKRAAATCLNVGGGWVVSGGWWMVVLVVPRIRIIIIIIINITSFLGNNLNWIRIMSKQSELDSDYFRLPEEAFWLPQKSELDVDYFQIFQSSCNPTSSDIDTTFLAWPMEISEKSLLMPFCYMDG